MMFERIAFAVSAILLSLSMPNLVFLPVAAWVVLELVESSDAAKRASKAAEATGTKSKI
jgi:hypothetical protein